MLVVTKTCLLATCCLALVATAWTETGSAASQGSANSGSITGVVTDPSGAVVSGATITIHNPVSGFERAATTDGDGHFTISNIPFNSYHLSAKASGFSGHAEDVDVRSTVPVSLTLTLEIGASTETVNVESAGDLIETDSTFHTDIDKNLIDRLPVANATSGLSELVTRSTPGISADSNGQAHGLGEHADNQYSLDGQPVTDQNSKVFSNQLPVDAVQSLEVISGAPPAEYGDKTSVVVNVTTRSGQNVTRPTGQVSASYGTFGTVNVGLNLAYGGPKWGNFFSINGLNGGRFLDPPEFVVTHAKGNEENFFDRVDWQMTPADSFHLNFGFTRSWFQTPNSFDQETAGAWNGLIVNNGGIGPDGVPVGPADQRSQIKTFNIAPSWTRVLSNTAVFTLGAYVRHDQYNYYPSDNPFADLAPSLQSQTVGQDRTLTNAGIRPTFSYVKGIHNIKLGATYQQTLLDENDRLGIVDPTFNDPTSPVFNPNLAPYDLTRGGTLFLYHGHTDIKQLALFAQDSINAGNWAFNLGLRQDFYNGLVVHRETQPRLGVAYTIKRTSTVLRASYARILETPYNENLVLSSEGCGSPVLNPLLGCSFSGATPLSPGWRNEFHAGIQQAFGKYVVFSGEYIWKYTHNDFDFSVLGNTPITFPIEWHNSKIPGFAGRISVPTFHGFSALVVFSSVAARFFTPQIGGAGETPSAPGGVFRIDHDERFNQTTHLQYQPWARGPWFSFNWRYDSGQVAGRIPCAGGDCNNGPAGSDSVVDTSIISPDQQFQAGLSCGGVAATPTTPISSALGTNLCPASQYTSKLIKIPAAGTANADGNPPRIASRNLFDVAIGHDDLFHGDRYKWGVQLTAINMTNEKALYNFLSTFSGTHYVTPRTLTAQLTFNF
jgi:hypothetical protein